MANVFDAVIPARDMNEIQSDKVKNLFFDIFGDLGCIFLIGIVIHGVTFLTDNRCGKICKCASVKASFCLTFERCGSFASFRRGG